MPLMILLIISGIFLWNAAPGKYFSKACRFCVPAGAGRGAAAGGAGTPQPARILRRHAVRNLISELPGSRNCGAITCYRHTHPGTLTSDQQLADLKQTQDVYQAAFGAVAPAYRFPFLEETPTLMAALKAEQLAVMSVDLGIGDWEADVTTGMLAARLLESLQATGGGIILMHDAYGPPANASLVLLKLLKQNG